jgi:hypothetical protein
MMAEAVEESMGPPHFGSFQNHEKIAVLIGLF